MEDHGASNNTEIHSDENSFKLPFLKNQTKKLRLINTIIDRRENNSSLIYQIVHGAMKKVRQAVHSSLQKTIQSKL